MKIKRKIPMYIAVQLESGDNRVWLPLPAGKKTFAAALEKIGGDKGDFRIKEYNCRVPAMSRGLLKTAPLSVVNHLASRLNTLCDDDIVKLCAICDSDHFFDCLGQFIDFTFQTYGYNLLPGITDEEKLGARFINNPKHFAVDETIKLLVDRCDIGRKLAAKENGVFTPFGYLASKIGWELPPTFRRVPANLNLKGYLGEDIYCDWNDYDVGVGKTYG